MKTPLIEIQLNTATFECRRSAQMDLLYGKSKNTQTSKTTIVALPERGTFHSLIMVGKENEKKSNNNNNKSGENK